LAADAGTCRLRGNDDVIEFPEISKKAEIKNERGQGVKD
jgi:hypothetical protein